MDIIAIDPSLICTALVVNDKKFVYTGTHISHTDKGKYKTWFANVDDLITVRSYDFSALKSGSHAETELRKFNLYRLIAKDIANDIRTNRAHQTYRFCIEGYSYSSSAGPLIDLVTYGTILKYTLLNDAGLSEFTVIPPQELKTKAASLVYAKDAGKNKPYRNKNGVAAGSFTKRDMLQCLLDDSSLTLDPWVARLHQYSAELTNLKSTPKPIEDLNDAKLMFEWIKRS